MFYPAFIYKIDSGGYDGYFPDMEGCFFAGDTLDEAMKDAEKAFAQYAQVLTEQGLHVPAPKNPDSYIGDERLVEDGGTLTLINLDPAKYETKSVKFNLTMPGNLLAAIDNYIEDHGTYKNRSSFLAELARKELTNH
ncbi:type II toxin-antitoxin system HicB family antitoxin [Siccibacter colletis]|uniref:type II toxin-antitoxin system HicB family antitoxin n=1 Tax=Siccibacter colletis TaxID=1505757 RepID=UPI003CF951E4